MRSTASDSRVVVGISAVLAIGLAALLASSPAQAQAAQGRTVVDPTSPPPDWEQTKARIRDLQFAGEDQKVIAIVEPIVAARPRFADGQARLGGAHESLARTLARTDRALAEKHFELAATHLRQAFELGGGQYPDATIRGLIDLYDYALPRPATWKGTELDAAFRKARLGLPAAGPRLDYASLLIGLAARNAQPAVRTALVREALALADDVVKKSPSDRSIRQKADAVKEEAARLRISDEPACVP
jgi:hypothetical protein